jgi:hypothetical protein
MIRGTTERLTHDAELANRVAEILGDAVTLSSDDYQAGAVGPTDLLAWLRDGADPAAWQIPQLAADLGALRRGIPVVVAGSTIPLSPAPYIIVEEPAGRGRPDLRSALDLVAVIDIPAEIALARRIRREIAGEREPADSSAYLQALDAYLSWYVIGMHDVYAAVNRHALASCDLILDGSKPIDELAQQVVELVTAWRNETTGHP